MTPPPPRSLRPARTIRAKLRRLVLISVGLALVMNAAFGLMQEAQRYIESKRDTLLATAQVFGAASAPAVAERDERALLGAIRAISRVPGLVFVEVEDRAGEPLSQIGSAVRLVGDLDISAGDSPSALQVLRSRTVQVSVPVVHGGEEIGRLTLVSETSDLPARFRTVITVSAIGSVAAIAFGLLTSMRLQKSITGPLTELGRTMSRIERTHDYSTNMPVSRTDELGALASSFNSMMGEIRRTSRAIEAREEEIILRLSRATERRDGETGDHIMRMATLCRLTAEALGLDPERVSALHRAAPLHDVGKVGVPDAIMFKKGRLDPEERRAMEQHAEYGWEVLRDSESELIQLAAEMALSHHERWDGTGYPRGLSGEAIPLSARIASVADVTDALASPRAYKAGWSLAEVRGHLVENSGKAFDPACVRALLSRWDEVAALYPAASSPAGEEPVAA